MYLPRSKRRQEGFFPIIGLVTTAFLAVAIFVGTAIVSNPENKFDLRNYAKQVQEGGTATVKKTVNIAKEIVKSGAKSVKTVTQKKAEKTNKKDEEEKVAKDIVQSGTKSVQKVAEKESKKVETSESETSAPVNPITTTNNDTYYSQAQKIERIDCTSAGGTWVNNGCQFTAAQPKSTTSTTTQTPTTVEDTRLARMECLTNEGTWTSGACQYPKPSTVTKPTTPITTGINATGGVTVKPTGYASVSPLTGETYLVNPNGKDQGESCTGDGSECKSGNCKSYYNSFGQTIWFSENKCVPPDQVQHESNVSANQADMLLAPAITAAALAIPAAGIAVPEIAALSGGSLSQIPTAAYTYLTSLLQTAPAWVTGGLTALNVAGDIAAINQIRQCGNNPNNPECGDLTAAAQMGWIGQGVASVTDDLINLLPINRLRNYNAALQQSLEAQGISFKTFTPENITEVYRGHTNNPNYLTPEEVGGFFDSSDMSIYTRANSVNEERALLHEMGHATREIEGAADNLQNFFDSLNGNPEATRLITSALEEVGNMSDNTLPVLSNLGLSRFEQLERQYFEWNTQRYLTGLKMFDEPYVRRILLPNEPVALLPEALYVPGRLSTADQLFYGPTNILIPGQNEPSDFIWELQDFREEGLSLLPDIMIP